MLMQKSFSFFSPARFIPFYTLGAYQSELRPKETARVFAKEVFRLIQLNPLSKASGGR